MFLFFVSNATDYSLYFDGSCENLGPVGTVSAVATNQFILPPWRTGQVPEVK
jgi:hypothetical protein